MLGMDRSLILTTSLPNGLNRLVIQLEMSFQEKGLLSMQGNFFVFKDFSFVETSEENRMSSVGP